METRTEIYDEVEELDRVIRNSNRSKTSVAEELGVTRQALNMWLRGARNPSEKNLKKIKKFVEKTEVEIFFDNEDANEAYIIGAVEVPEEVFVKLMVSEVSEVKETVREALLKFAEDQ